MKDIYDAGERFFYKKMESFGWNIDDVWRTMNICGTSKEDPFGSSEWNKPPYIVIGNLIKLEEPISEGKYDLFMENSKARNEFFTRARMRK